ncbi:MAG: efflux RND transporter periplasmic adaptor subunit [Gammaproteobacteria bacterium]|nr:MAG: efflux RND transporter periplasmic adaptor subunit [Gammaproteobacteria bacterium]
MALDKNKLDALRLDSTEPEKSNIKSVFLTLLFISIAALLGFGGFKFWKSTQETLTVDTFEVKMLGSNQPSAILEASGYIVTRKNATLAATVTARVLNINVEEGDVVQKGDEIAVLDGSLVSKDITLSESRLKVAQSKINEAHSQLVEAKNKYARFTKLSNNDYVSEDLLDQAKQRVSTLKAMLVTAKSNVQVEKDNVNRLHRHLEEYFINAPFSGVVISKDAQVGEIVSPISSGEFTRTGICTIVDMDSREIEVNVNEAYINRVQKDQKVIAQLDAYQNWEVSGQVINIIPTADRQKATVKVRIAINELDPKILPDMGVKVKFFAKQEEDKSDEDSENTIVIPKVAVVRDAESSFVWLINNNSVSKKEITLGKRIGNLFQVDKGLSAGDKIAISKLEKLKERKQVITSSQSTNE